MVTCAAVQIVLQLRMIAVSLLFLFFFLYSPFLVPTGTTHWLHLAVERTNCQKSRSSLTASLTGRPLWGQKRLAPSQPERPRKVTVSPTNRWCPELGLLGHPVREVWRNLNCSPTSCGRCQAPNAGAIWPCRRRGHEELSSFTSCSCCSRLEHQLEGQEEER